jgi:serine/threonine protein kinase
VLGTADYLAPEQALDSHAVDIRADIYSLGATLYFLLAGKSPFQEGTVAQKLIWHQVRQPKSIRQLRPEVPEELASVIGKMMAKDPEERYCTPAEVVEALMPWTQAPIAPPPEEEMPQLGRAAVNESASRTIASSQRLAMQVLMPITVPPGTPPADSPIGRSDSHVPVQAGSTLRDSVARDRADTPRAPGNRKPGPSGRDDADVFGRTKETEKTADPPALTVGRRVWLWILIAAAGGLALIGVGAFILWMVARNWLR